MPSLPAVPAVATAVEAEDRRPDVPNTESPFRVRIVSIERLVNLITCPFVSGLPPTGSWQDLKDHMREAGDVCYADVFKDGTGVVEFLRYEDMKYAVKKLDDSRFRSHEVSHSSHNYRNCLINVLFHALGRSGVH